MLLALGSPPAGADDEEHAEEHPTRLYGTREEQREAGIEHELTPWLTAAGLVEWEASRERLSGAGVEETEDESEIVLELGLAASLNEAVAGEVELEYDSGSDRLFADEAVMVLENEPWELSLGKQYLPFGVFYSGFVAGPLVEFGETRVHGATLSYGRDDRLELLASVYRGRSREIGTGSREVNGALALEAWPAEHLFLALGYMGNLADVDDRLLEDEGNRFARRVPGVSAHLLWTTDEFELSFEALGATRSFEELDPDRERPRAWNLEFMRFAHPRFDWALRLEGSEELEDAPELRYGAALSFRLHPRASLTVEYLRGRFQEGLAGDDGESFDRANRVGLLLAVAF